MQTKIRIRLNISTVKWFVTIVNSYKSDIDLICGHIVLDAKSIMAIYILDFSRPLFVEIHSDDKDEIAKFNIEMEGFRYEDTDA